MHFNYFCSKVGFVFRHQKSLIKKYEIEILKDKRETLKVMIEILCKAINEPAKSIQYLKKEKSSLISNEERYELLSGIS
jgi:hypothetical protein